MTRLPAEVVDLLMECDAHEVMMEEEVTQAIHRLLAILQKTVGDLQSELRSYSESSKVSQMRLGNATSFAFFFFFAPLLACNACFEMSLTGGLS